MKKINYFFLSGIFVLLSAAGNSGLKAQKEQGKSVITAGVGYSLVGILMGFAKDLINTAPNANVIATKTPVIAGMYDFGISENFSLGAAYTYQALNLNYDIYEDANGGFVIGDFKDKFMRQNFGVRTLFHFGKNEKMDSYAGLRLGYTLWSYQTQRTDLKDWNSGKFNNSIWPQALFGMRYFFIENLGFNLEFAIGPTYYTMIGINGKF